ncbi:hypothetical protein CSUI_009656 [Cystoisospora suis]|uniref:Uncharacterized protein n=1 Tax=Cystoisospora suis TaxID=483139 RepID=A0A2C6KG67_9APIC|nr:hypothetical protein CSUI_009656 [Cystoisospora suis]
MTQSRWSRRLLGVWRRLPVWDIKVPDYPENLACSCLPRVFVDCTKPEVVTPIPGPDL